MKGSLFKWLPCIAMNGMSIPVESPNHVSEQTSLVRYLYGWSLYFADESDGL